MNIPGRWWAVIVVIALCAVGILFSGTSPQSVSPVGVVPVATAPTSAPNYFANIPTAQERSADTLAQIEANQEQAAHDAKAAQWNAHLDAMQAMQEQEQGFQQQQDNLQHANEDRSK